MNTVDALTVYRAYFTRNHAYRTGQLTRPHRALLYIDDDFEYLTQSLLGDLTAFTDVTCYSDNSSTTATNYLGNLSRPDFKFVQVLVHSDYTKHSFKPYSSQNEVNATRVRDCNSQALFYLLNACSASRFNETNNLGTQYLFANSTLAVVGATNVQGATATRPFYNLLKERHLIGKAVQYLQAAGEPCNQMGMCLLGDPLLSII